MLLLGPAVRVRDKPYSYVGSYPTNQSPAIQRLEWGNLSVLLLELRREMDYNSRFLAVTSE